MNTHNKFNVNQFGSQQTIPHSEERGNVRRGTLSVYSCSSFEIILVGDGIWELRSVGYVGRLLAIGLAAEVSYLCVSGYHV